MERGEKLGINQAVRDAVGEIRRNVQGFNDTRNAARMASSPMPAAVAVMERRNRQLAAMLDESVTNLKILATSNLDGDKDKYVEMIDMAAAKIQFVKVHLEDSSLSLPEEDLPAINNLSISPHTERRSPTVALDTTPVVMTSAVESARSTLSSPDSIPQNDGPLQQIPAEEEDPLKAAPTLPPLAEHTPTEAPPAEDADRMDTDVPEPQPGPDTSTTASTEGSSTNPTTTSPAPVTNERPVRNIPNRSSLAQSSFSWMLEPDDTAATSMKSSSTSPPQPYFTSSRPSSNGPARKGTPKSSTANASRERNAFLFGEVTSPDGAGRGGGGLEADEIFGLLPIRNAKGKGARGGMGL